LTRRSHGCRSQIEDELEALLARSDQDPSYTLAAFAVCLVLMQRLAIGLPPCLRRTWAMELYQLADALAEDKSAGPTSEDLQK
jgi:hypothetical protein